MNDSQPARMREAFDALSIDRDATYVVTAGEAAPEPMAGTTVHDLIRAQTRLASCIQQDGTGKISVRLTSGGRLCTYENSDAVRARSAALTGVVTVTASVTPGEDAFEITGASQYDTGVKRRIFGGITRAGLDFPTGRVAVRIDDHRRATYALDLAMACAILAAGGQIDARALDEVVCLGEMGWDGFVVAVQGVLEDSLRAAYESGARTVLVPATQVIEARRMGFDGLTVIGARHLTQAIDALNEFAAQN